MTTRILALLVVPCLLALGQAQAQTGVAPEHNRHDLRTPGVHLDPGLAPDTAPSLIHYQARFTDTVLHAVTVENKLFGRPTTVAGLLAGRDLLEAARGKVAPGDLVLVPDESVNEHGVFLDDLTPGQLAEELGVPVHAGWEPLLGGAGEEDDRLDDLLSLEVAS